MDAHDIDDLAGIYEEDGCVKCKACMVKKDYRGLTREQIITARDIKDKIGTVKFFV